MPQVKSILTRNGLVMRCNSVIAETGQAYPAISVNCRPRSRLLAAVREEPPPVASP
jgi:hypothetical protein